MQVAIILYVANSKIYLNATELLDSFFNSCSSRIEHIGGGCVGGEWGGNGEKGGCRLGAESGVK